MASRSSGGGGISGIIIPHYLAERRKRKFTEAYPRSGPSVKRLLPVVEYLRHHRIERSAYYQIYAGVVLAAVPHILHLAEKRLVDIFEVLELIEHKCEMPTLRNLHHGGEQADHAREVSQVFSENITYRVG